MMKLNRAGPLLGLWNCRCYNIFIRALTKLAGAKGQEISKAIILETPHLVLRLHNLQIDRFPTLNTGASHP